MRDVPSLLIRIRGSTVMQKFMKSFIADESGATAIEYGLIAALIAVGIIAAASLLGNNLETTFNNLGTSIGNANTEAGTYTAS